MVKIKAAAVLFVLMAMSWAAPVGTVQAQVKCWNCDQIYYPTPQRPNCPYCGSPRKPPPTVKR